MKDAVEIQDDLARMDHDDPAIKAALEHTRRVYKSKGIPYYELLRSKFYGTVKYILVELHDEHGTVLITDMDTNQTYRLVDMVSRFKKSNVQQWIESNAA